MFFDLNIKGSSFDDNLKLAIEASRYGWEHINFSYDQNDFKQAQEFRDELSDNLENIIDFDYTLEIKSNNVNEIRKIVRKFRNRASCISVVGGDLKVNRAVLENVQIDVLSRPYLRRYDSGLNHVLAKEALRNNVAVELCFKDVLKSYLAPRSKVISNFKDVYTLYRKFDFPLILSSRAESVFDLRTAPDFLAFFTQTGLTVSEIEKSFMTAKNILNFNENRKNMILTGVRRVDDEA
ncbi:MAG: RNase P subunit p30 family protein [Methanobrevibacter sp.]|uniref:ribonuclease P protein component 3 n=1 Tax=Methanobrevibacter sp. TaxID=66852 RepID=UPI002E7A8E8D|nr:RNase P subunit p30 family protein [Methanobrevibacter sp.]MEE0936250.1 RNase P subunit p30 family protein [Methanobrevibacter sp.]